MRLTRGALLAIASAVCFGSLGVFVKLAHAEGWNDPSLLAVRFALASVTILPFALRARSAPRLFGAAFLIGAIGYAATTAMYFPSFRYLPTAVASFLLYLAPALVALLATLFLRERLGRRGLAALALALAGLALLASGAFTGELSLVGVALATGSAVSYAATTVLARSVAQRMPWSHLTLGVSLGAAASFTLFSVATRQLAVPPGTRALLWALGIGVLATGVSLSLFFAALGRASASHVSVISTLEPVSTLVLAAFFLAEIPSWLGIAGGALILGGAALIAAQEPIVAPHE
ncbi:MAG TPA: DMT family transporter [Candidatus Thermoplasmatota archaeon]|nr:DMT family transporter [Candidatus Thermoplasmatota archaeon]